MKFKEINVFFDNGTYKRSVGILAMVANKILFEYDNAWIDSHLELAPIQLPTSRRSFQFETSKLVNSVPGLFGDSLPDGWGLLIMDRFFNKKGIKRDEITPIDRLAYLGEHAMGALCYKPSLDHGNNLSEAVDIGEAARDAYELFEGKVEDASRLLAKIGGSPGGARPKALIGISDSGREFVSGIGALPDGFSHWMIKFSGLEKNELRSFGPYEGVLEYIYLEIAKAAGINVPEYRLIDDGSGIRHIAVRRFDRPSINQRLHLASACGMLHADCGLPSLDYQDLLRLAWKITADITQVSEQFRRAVFNFFAVNRDDHSKNHGYIMDKNGKWTLSPAYDITFSRGPGGEHWTSFLGEGKALKIETLVKLAEGGSIKKKEALSIIDQVRTAIADIPRLCKENSVPLKVAKPLHDELQNVSLLVKSGK